ncbi:ABC transporter ATP-binding protein [Streptomyces halstedii]|uniref:ABC transporter ATP-binding protein n=1 Tax=Streptomyces TaxID=1883 RepID=UPI0004B70986|nr:MULTISPECIES: ABC transporter ATP-binding protein [Streptomyces]MYR72229.1 ATP-binding cassette domain-containing protein [Streptomyces sp. SID4925]MYY16416.1 ATP-binding cassette domain-containing protein [Streptomyces sp. SID4912]SBU99222.1 branched-chain amino acid transport system ATP-binding protein [Streptomyces sp. OspMP-M45]SCD76858.1 amino acid/amide ABC transporter ATP-binding protein 2, HAAT family [Streptomyces sp. PpalLS-921]SCD83486.1 amino acid/amide ABC transporter ATP-bindi
MSPGRTARTVPTARPAEGGPLLAVRGLRVLIGGRHILHGVDLDVAAQGVTALLGRNGAGKTTTVRGVLGLVPRTGSVLLDGEETVGLATHTLVRRGIGYAPEDRGVFAGLTVAENLRLAERGDGEPDYALVHELFPELLTRARQAAGTLSGGQQQMVAIGRTLLNGNRLIIADEPTKGLAPKVVTEVTSVLERAAEAVPVLLVEQNLAMVRRLATHCAVLADGRTAHQGPAAALLGDPEATRRLLGVGRAPSPAIPPTTADDAAGAGRSDRTEADL